MEDGKRENHQTGLPVGEATQVADPAPSLDAAIPRRSISSESRPSLVAGAADLPAIPRRSTAPAGPHAPGPQAGPVSGMQGMSIPRKPVSAHRQLPSMKPSATRRPSTGSTGRPAPQLPRARQPPPAIRIISEQPFVVAIRTKGVPLHLSGIPRTRSAKRKRPAYHDLEDTDDSDDFLDDEEEDEDHEAGNGKRRVKKMKKSKSPNVAEELSTLASSGVPIDTEGDAMVVDGLPLVGEHVDAPPPGVLSSLWYSREQVLHIWVVDKILGWRIRPVTSLEWSDPDAPTSLEQTEAAAISTKVLADEEFWKDQHKRAEVSRINPTHCPMVMHICAKKEAQKAKLEGREVKYELKPYETTHDTEEVFLVKWRGRSYMHCSWERKKDLEKLDPSNNNAARSKIRRYIQNQEIAHGKNWKQVLEAERGVTQTSEDGTEQPISDEEFFPSQFLEVERLLACDESQMDTSILAKQRALNIREEQQLLSEREKEELPDGMHHKHVKRLFEKLPLLSDVEDPWDPEDYVRYVVKWKGQNYSEMTWEYWINIKRDAVDLAEDFWYRQQAPDPEEIRKLPPHPHVRDFRKLTESPVFGLSKMKRPVADLGDGFVVEEEEDEDLREFRLRSYQLEGVNWLLFNWWNKRSCILADEMGLGKTIQSTGFLDQLHKLPQTQVRGPFLIVAPLSLIGQWQSESQTWAPDLNVVFYHGSADAREFLSQQEFYYTDQFTPKQVAAKLKKMHVTKFHTLITTYEVVLKDVEVLKKIRWKALIVDEAHRLKNPKSKLFEELASVPRDFCLLLTGTPLQNSTEELWALLNFADPAVFKSKDEFVEKFGELSDAKQVSELHTVLKPYLLRRVKEDVEKSLPPKEETILEVTLTPIQKTYYKAIYERNTAFLFKGAKPSNAPSLMNVMMELRKVCNHPFLIRGAEERIVADAVSAAKEKDENGNEAMIEPIKIFGEQLIKSSGKFVLMAKLLPKLFAGGHKVLIFSQMVRALDLLEELLKWKKYRYERLDGSTNATSRAAAVERFTRKACKRFVMLLSTRAGGLGLNLTAADTVVIFDSDWNPQNDLQAMARSHRIGQTRPVRVYRLLTAKTYEMHMFHTASMKLGLDRAVLAHQRQQGEDDSDSKGTKKSDREVQAKEIDELLKKGAYDVFRDDDDKEAQKFMETDIDQLLEQSATKVTYGQVTSSLSSGLGSFSKASFVADTGDGGKDVDLDDPDFWAKAIGLDKPEETPEDVAQMIDDGVKRSRRQVQVYDPYAELAEAEQKKKDKIAQRVKEEKEEKERLRLEKKLRKLEEKEKKRKQKEQELVKSFAAPSPTTTPEPEEKKPRDSKPKKLKKSERSKAQRRAEYEDPTYERLKQAWDVPQRNRGSSSLLRFGFGRFCKLRSDSNYTSLALQDMEIFARAYLFQIALQVAVSIMKRLKEQNCASRELSDIIDGEFKSAVGFWLGNNSEAELSWICESVVSALRMHAEVQSYKRFLRMPLCLADDEYVTDLRKGQALRALRRLGILERLNCILTEVIDDIIASLGSDEMGRRGCLVKDYATIDTDLKARHITGEELVVALGARLPSAMKNPRSPAVWWDRSCDLGLLVGSFIHGFGNYEAMRADDELPFLKLIDSCAAKDDGCSEAARFFTISTMVARQVFDEALESSKAKAQLEAHAAVAAVVAATKKAQAERETDGPIKDATLGITEIVNEIDNDSDDLHMVTLPRLNRRMSGALRKALRGEEIEDVEVVYKPGEALPMPDPRVLDARLAELVELMETKSIPSCPVPLPVNPLVSEVSDMASMTMEILAKSSRGLTTKQQLLGREFHGLGLSGNQCGSAHRSLDDGGDYAVSSASTDLNFVATGNEGPRYLRALGVPIYITRYAIVATVNADSKTVQCMLVNERLRNYGTSEEKSGNAVDNENAKNNESAKNSESSIKHDDCKDDATGVPKSIPQIIPHDLIPMLIRDNTKIRASICAIALHYGCPVGRLSGVSISDTIVHALQQYTPYSEAVSSMFTLKDFCARVRFLSGATEMPPEHEVRDYLETILLPHCLRMAVYGNGPTTRHTRVSKGTFETSHGISLYPEPFLPAQTPLPDPCCAASEHSMEAILGAGAILRRVRLVRAAQYAVGGALSFEKLEEIFSSKKIRNSMDHLPIWWNPRIHDLALLVTVASEGVFGVLSRRQGSVFDKNSGVIPEQVKSLSKSLSGSEEDMSEFVKATCSEFPSPRAIERRLALLCSEATKSLDDETCYYHLPMFDHGGWPRN